jgi:restriction system protein
MASAARRTWVVRAGQGGEILDQVEAAEVVAIGWRELGDCAGLRTREDFRVRYARAYPEDTYTGNSGQPYRFVQDVQLGDTVLTPDKRSRELLVGEVTGAYRYDPSFADGAYPHLRAVRWRGRIARDGMSDRFRASTGNMSTLFTVDGYDDEIETLLGAPTAAEAPAEAVAEPEPYSFLETTRATADELIADLVARVPWYTFEELVAAVLRSLGFCTRLTRRGPDGGVDIVAHPDALGFEEPRVKVQVKHQKGTTGAPDVRNFRSTVAPGEKGLFVCTGGFTRDALQEPLRAGAPLVLMDRDEFVALLLDNYDALDPEFKALVPLERVYIPTRV